MPSASEAIATTAKPGLLPSARSAYRRSWASCSTVPLDEWAHSSVVTVLLLRDRLNRKAHLHFVADEEPAGLERGIPGQPEILPVQRGLRLEPGALFAPGID